MSFLLIFRVWFNLKPTLLLKDQQKPQLVTTGEWSGKKGPLVLSWSQEHLTLLGYAENFFAHYSSAKKLSVKSNVYRAQYSGTKSVNPEKCPASV